MLNRARRGQPAQPGFTIVELLIVVVVIAILAAITIVSYNGIQNRTRDTAVQSDLRQLGVKISQYYLENNDTFPYPNASQVGSLGVKASRDSYGNHHDSGGNFYNFLYCYSATDRKFALFGASKSGNTYKYDDGSVSSISGMNGSAVLCNSVGVSSSDRVVHWLYGQGGTNEWSSWI